MIRLLLKHIIYELCIDVFFNSVKNNFLYAYSPYDVFEDIARIMKLSHTITRLQRRAMTGVDFQTTKNN